MSGILSLVHEEGRLDVPDSTLIVGVDDTGNDYFSDKNFPLFGLGGCAIMAKDYYDFLDIPWRSIKESFFGGADKKLHASELKKPTKDQLNALAYFFHNFPFFRFAVMAANTFENQTSETNLHLVCHHVLQSIADFAKWVQPTGIIIIAENSDRIRIDLLKHFSAYRIGNGSIEIKPRVFTASKEVRATCVEVADFVIHPAGAQVRNRLRGYNNKFSFVRKDFEAVFYNIDSRLVSYRELLSAEPQTA